jgi:uncharacterized protein YggE
MYENIEKQRNYNSMTVTGRGSVTAIPDMAIIRLGVLTTGDNLSIVQEENARISQTVLEGLRQMGITDIRTYRYNIDKLYDYENNSRIDRGYSVRNLFEIQTDMLDISGTIIDTAVSLGANLVESITFEVSETDRYYLEALNMALINATDKAKSIAGEFGARLNTLPIRIVENSSPPVPLARAYLGEGQITTPVEPGTTQIEASVLLEFSYM